MDATPTLEEVGKAVHDLREAVEAKSVDQNAIKKISEFLDGAEEKNQELTKLQAESAQHAEDMKEYKEKLEKAGATETEAKSRMDDLEAELANFNKETKDVDYHDSVEYKALDNWCKIGDNISAEEKVLLRTDSAVDGGLLTLAEMDSEITKKIVEISGIRSIARVRSISAKSMEMAIRATIPVATYEGEADTGLDSASTYESETVVPFRQTFTVPITQDMLQDAAFGMESEITGDAGEAFAFGEGNGFVVGTGFKQPSGFTIDSRLTTNNTQFLQGTGTSAELNPIDLMTLTGELKVGYNPFYVFTRKTLAIIRTFRGDAASAGDKAGQFLWNPGMGGQVANTLNGFPYILANDMPEVAATAFAVAFGDFRRGYTITDRTGMSLIRDNLTLKKKAIVEFTMNRWNTGQVTLPEAIKLLRIKT